AALPDLDLPAAMTLCATETSDAPLSENHQNFLRSCLALSGRLERTPVDSGGKHERTESEGVGGADVRELQQEPRKKRETGVYGNRTHWELCSNPPLVLKTRAPTRGANTPECRFFSRKPGIHKVL